MYNHELKDYTCPFCKLIAGTESEHNKKQDIIFQNEQVTAFIAPKWWINNPGHVLVVPNKHLENIYDMPDDLLGEVYKVVKKVSIAIRSTYDCDGTSNRQHNEPAGGQDVWHFHVHVYPRYDNDKLYQNHDKKSFVDASARTEYADKLKHYFEETL
jgi:histidine triad (HIT) family protein